MTLVVDASVAVKLGVVEDGADRAKALVMSGARLIAPDLLVCEVANALWRKELRGDLDARERALALNASLDAFDEFTSCQELAERAADLAMLLQHPVYDCFYLVLAAARDAAFVTADKRLLARLATSGWAGRYAAL